MDKPVFTAADSAQLAEKLTFWFGAVIDNLNGGSGSNGALSKLFGNGRIVGGTMTTGQITLPPSPALGFKMPAGSSYLFNGMLYTLVSDVVISDAPPNKTSTYPIVTFDSDGNPSVSSYSDTRPAAGLGSLGQLTTDDTHTTAIDATPLTQSDVIQIHSALLPRIGSGGGGGDDVDYWGDLAFASDNPQLIMDAINAAVAALAAQVITGQRPVQQPLDDIMHKLQLLRANLAQLEDTVNGRADIIERDQSATIGKDLGSGEHSGPQFTGSGDMSKNTDGTFG